MSSKLEGKIQQKVQLLPDPLQQRVLTLIDELLREQEKFRPLSEQPIWEIFERLSQQVPLEEWSKFSKRKNDRSYSFIGIGHGRQHSSSKRAKDTCEHDAKGDLRRSNDRDNTDSDL